MDEGLINGLLWLIDKGLSVFRDFLFYHFDLVLSFVEGLVTDIPAPSFLQSVSGIWDALPPQMVYILGQIGIVQALSILGGAFLVRFTLNLIPSVFTRV